MKSICSIALSVVAIFGLAVPVAHATTTTFPTKIFLQSDGVALSSFPGKNKLHQVVQVDRTQGTTPITWTATSNEPWLSVTASGQTGQSLTVKADPAQVTGTGLQLGQITVSTSGGDFSDSETIRVGFYVGTAVPGLITMQKNALHIAANPVEPVAYVSNDNANITAYNVYDGTVLATFNHVAPKVGAMEVSSDGLTLFAADLKNSRIVAINADTGTQIASYPAGHKLDDVFNMVFARPFGQPAIYLSGAGIIAVPSGDVLVSAGFPSYEFIAVTPNGMKAFGIADNSSPAGLTSYSISLVDDGLVLTQVRRKGANGGATCQDLAASHDGARVYTGCGYPHEFDVFDGTSLKLKQALDADASYPDNVEVDANDDFVGGIDGMYSTDDVFTFNKRGFSKGKVPTTTQGYYHGQQQATMKISGDCARVISATGVIPGQKQTLQFRNMP